MRGERRQEAKEHVDAVEHKGCDDCRGKNKKRDETRKRKNA